MRSLAFFLAAVPLFGQFTQVEIRPQNTTTSGTIRWWNSTNTHKVTMSAPAGLAGDYALKLPPALPGSIACVTLDNTGQLDTLACAATGGRYYVDAKLDCGLVGDGMTEEAAAIQTCITNASATPGAIIVFPTGQYVMATQLTQGNGSTSGEATQGHQVILMGISSGLGSNATFQPQRVLTGVVTVSGVNVTWASGDEFLAACIGNTVVINGTTYRIINWVDKHHITLSQSASSGGTYSLTVTYRGGTEFVWVGGLTNTPMFQYNGPLHNVGMYNITWDANNTAGGGVWFDYVGQSMFTNVVTTRWTSLSYRMKPYVATGAVYFACGNTFTGLTATRVGFFAIGLSVVNYTVSGLLLDGTPSGPDACSNRFYSTSLEYYGDVPAGTYGIQLAYADNNQFYSTNLPCFGTTTLTCPGGGPPGVLFTQQTFNSAYPQDNMFVHLSANAVGGLSGTGGNSIIGWDTGDSPVVPQLPHVTVSDYSGQQNGGMSYLTQDGATGFVNTSGGTVTLARGDYFNPSGGWNGLTITINGTDYAVGSVTSNFQLTLGLGTGSGHSVFNGSGNGDAGIQTSVPYTVLHPTFGGMTIEPVGPYYPATGVVSFGVNTGHFGPQNTFRQGYRIQMYSQTGPNEGIHFYRTDTSGGGHSGLFIDANDNFHDIRMAGNINFWADAVYNIGSPDHRPSLAYLGHTNVRKLDLADVNSASPTGFWDMQVQFITNVYSNFTFRDAGGVDVWFTSRYAGGAKNKSFIYTDWVPNNSAATTLGLPAPTLGDPGTNGSGAAVTVTITSGAVTGCNVTTGGSGYAAANSPDATIVNTGATNGAGAGISLHVNGSGAVDTCLITSAGSGYTSAAVNIYDGRWNGFYSKTVIDHYGPVFLRDTTYTANYGGLRYNAGALQFTLDSGGTWTALGSGGTVCNSFSCIFVDSVSSNNVFSGATTENVGVGVFDVGINNNRFGAQYSARRGLFHRYDTRALGGGSSDGDGLYLYKSENATSPGVLTVLNYTDQAGRLYLPGITIGGKADIAASGINADANPSVYVATSKLQLTDIGCNPIFYPCSGFWYLQAQANASNSFLNFIDAAGRTVATMTQNISASPIDAFTTNLNFVSGTAIFGGGSTLGTPGHLWPSAFTQLLVAGHNAAVPSTGSPFGSTGLYLYDDGGGVISNPIGFDGYYGSDPGGIIGINVIIARAARGSAFSPIALNTDDQMLAITGRGMQTNGSFSGGTVGIVFNVANQYTSFSTGGYMSLQVTPIGSTSRVEAARVNSDGAFWIGTASTGGAFRYNTGTGKMQFSNDRSTYVDIGSSSGSFSLNVTGFPALTGAVVLIPGTGITMSQSGQNITINGPTSGAVSSVGGNSPITISGTTSNPVVNCATCLTTNTAQTISASKTLAATLLASGLPDIGAIGSPVGNVFAHGYWIDNTQIVDSTRAASLFTLNTSGGITSVGTIAGGNLVMSLAIDAGTGGTGTTPYRINGTPVFDSSRNLVNIGSGTFASVITANGGITTSSSSNSTMFIGTGNFYNRNFSGGDASCGSVANGWMGIRTDTNQLQVCIGGVTRKVTLF